MSKPAQPKPQLPCVSAPHGATFGRAVWYHSQWRFPIATEPRRFIAASPSGDAPVSAPRPTSSAIERRGLVAERRDDHRRRDRLAAVRGPALRPAGATPDGSSGGLAQGAPVRRWADGRGASPSIRGDSLGALAPCDRARDRRGPGRCRAPSARAVAPGHRARPPDRRGRGPARPSQRGRPRRLARARAPRPGRRARRPLSALRLRGRSGGPRRRRAAAVRGEARGRGRGGPLIDAEALRRPSFGALLAAIAVAGLLVRGCALLDQPPLGDDRSAGRSAANFVEHGHPGPTMWHHPRLRDLLVWTSTRAAGDTKLGLVLPSLLLGVLTIPLVGLLGRRLAGPGACLVASGVAFGLGAASKWSVAFPLAVMLVWIGAAHLRERGEPPSARAARLAFAVAALGVVPATVYLLTWTPWFFQGRDLLDWVDLQRLMAAEIRTHGGFTEADLELPHEAWRWFVQPVAFADFTMGPHGPLAVVAITNPLVWPAALPALVFVARRAWRARRTEDALVAALFLGTYLPFLLTSRPIWVHSALAVLPFALVAIATLLVRLWDEGPRARVALLAYAAVVVSVPLLALATGHGLEVGALRGPRRALSPRRAARGPAALRPPGIAPELPLAHVDVRERLARGDAARDPQPLGDGVVHVVVPEPAGPPGEEQVRIPAQRLEAAAQRVGVLEPVDGIAVRHPLDVRRHDLAPARDGADAHEVVDDAAEALLRAEPAAVALAAGALDAEGPPAGRQRRARERGGHRHAHELLAAAEVDPLLLRDPGRARELEVVEDRGDELEPAGGGSQEPRRAGDRAGPDDAAHLDPHPARGRRPDPVARHLEGRHVRAEEDAPAGGRDARGEPLGERADPGARVQEPRIRAPAQESAPRERPEPVRAVAPVDDGAVHAGPRPVAVDLAGREGQEPLRVRGEELLVQRAAVPVHHLRLEGVAGEALAPQELETAPEEEARRQRRQDRGAKRPRVIPPERAHRARPRDLEQLAFERAGEEPGHLGVLGVEPVRSHVEEEPTVPERAGEAPHRAAR